MGQNWIVPIMCTVLFLCPTAGAREAEKVFAPPADLNLRLDAPIKSWDEALPLGNGVLGGLLWGEGNTLRLSLDRGDLWDLRIPDRFSEPDFTWKEMKKLVDAGDNKTLHSRFDNFYNRFKYPTKLPGGRLEITLDPGRKARAFELDLATATGLVHLEGGGVIRGFYSATRPVALFAVPGTDSIELALGAPAAVAQLGYADARTGRESDDSGSSVWYAQKSATDLHYAALAATRRTGTQTLIAVAICANRDGSDPLEAAHALVRETLDSGWKALHDPHLEFWRRFWSCSRLSIPDLHHLRHYYLVQYFYGAASRRGAPSIPLQGVWTADNGQLPPWHGDYHHDLNTQMTYDAYQTAGRFESGAAFVDHMYRLLPRFQTFARSFYEAPGAAIPAVMTQEGDPMTGWVMYSLSPTNGAWVGWLFYKHWLYTRDRKDLERGYAFCSELSRCLRHLLRENDEKTLELPLSSSPEIFDNRLQAFLEPNSNYDRDCMEALFLGTAHMARALAKPAEADAWRSAAENLGPRHVDDEGRLMYSPRDRMDQSHRHFSHTMAIHPFDLLTIEGTDSDKKIIASTMKQYDALGTDWWTGYSFSWMACMRARTGEPDTALRYLDIYEKAFILRNGFHVNGDQLKAGHSRFQYRPFTLEGNFLAAQAIHEMLLQSWHGIIRLFPAMPGRWTDASFDRLRAEGGFRVSARRAAGAIVSVRIEATADGTMRLLDNFGPHRPRWTGRSAGRAAWSVTKIGDLFVADMKAGDIVEARFD